MGCHGRPETAQRVIRPGLPLYLEGDPADTIYAVVEGCLREVRSLDDGRSQPVRLIRAGELAGAEAFAGGNYETSVETVTSARVCCIPAGTVRAQLHKQPSLGTAVMTELIGQLRAVREFTFWLGALSAEDRILALLRVFQDAAKPDAPFELPVSRLEMAELLSLAHATVSRTLRALARRGVLELSGRRVRILDGDAAGGGALPAATGDDDDDNDG